MEKLERTHLLLLHLDSVSVSRYVMVHAISRILRVNGTVTRGERTCTLVCSLIYETS